MTNRENFLSLLRRQGYERVPVEFVLCPHLQEVCRKELGAEDYEEYFGMPWRRVEDLKLKDHDVEKYRKYYEKKPLAEGADIDIWGVGHEKSPNSMHMTYMRHPLENVETLEELENYPYPDFASADGSHQAEQVKRIKERDLIALGDMQMTIWECAWYMRSMEELFCDMMMEDEKAEFLFDKVTELSMIRALSYAKAGVDVLFLGDDIGMQHTIMMSEELYCDWLKPRLKKIIDAVKAVNPDILILDEVLFVGDGAFRKKSEAKMREIITGGATTILVSHSIQQVRELCSKVLWLHKGRQIEFGSDVKGICDKYQAMLDGKLKLDDMEGTRA